MSFYSINPGNMFIPPVLHMDPVMDIRTKVADASAEDTLADWMFTNYEEQGGSFYDASELGFAANNFWLHFRLKFTDATAEMRIMARATISTYFVLLEPAAWHGSNTDALTGAPYDGGALDLNKWYDIDLHFTHDDCFVYVDGELHGTDDTNPINDPLAAIHILPDENVMVTEICTSLEDTRGIRISSRMPAGFGAGNTFAGNVADIQSLPITMDGISSTQGGDEAHLTQTPVNVSGMQVLSVQSSVIADTSGTPESPVLEHVLVNGSDEHLLGYTVHSTDSEQHGSDAISLANNAGNAFESADLTGFEMEIRNTVPQIGFTIFNTGSVVGFKPGSSVVHLGDRNVPGLGTIDYMYSNNSDTTLRFTGDVSSKTSLKVTLVKENGEWVSTTLNQVGSYTFENTEDDNPVTSFIWNNVNEKVYLIFSDVV